MILSDHFEITPSSVLLPGTRKKAGSSEPAENLSGENLQFVEVSLSSARSSSGTYLLLACTAL